MTNPSAIVTAYLMIWADAHREQLSVQGDVRRDLGTLCEIAFRGDTFGGAHLTIKEAGTVVLHLSVAFVGARSICREKVHADEPACQRIVQVLKQVALPVPNRIP